MLLHCRKGQWHCDHQDQWHSSHHLLLLLCAIWLQPDRVIAVVVECQRKLFTVLLSATFLYFGGDYWVSSSTLPT